MPLGGGGERRRRRWATPAAMMVAFKTAGVLDGAQVERRVVPLEPRAVAAGLRTRGWQGRRGVSARARMERASNAHGRQHVTMLARVRQGREMTCGTTRCSTYWEWLARGRVKAAGVCDTVLDRWASRACRAGAFADLRDSRSANPALGPEERVVTLHTCPTSGGRWASAGASLRPQLGTWRGGTHLCNSQKSANASRTPAARDASVSRA